MDSSVLVAIITAVGTIAVAAIGLLKKSSSKSTPAAPIVASREFMIGRWRVDQTVALVSGDAVLPASGGSDIIYGSEGKFQGAQTIAGREMRKYGRWDFAKLGNDIFRLTVHFDEPGMPPWQGTFQIVGPDRIHNTDQNYDAFRVGV